MISTIINNSISYESSNNDRIGSFNYTYNYETINERDTMCFIAFLKGKFRT